MDCHMQILEFLSCLKKHGLSYAFIGISFPSPITWTIIFKFWNFFPFSQNMDYLLQKRGLSSNSVSKNKFFFQKYGVSYAVFGIYFLSQKTWTIICNYWNFFPFSKN